MGSTSTPDAPGPDGAGATSGTEPAWGGAARDRGETLRGAIRLLPDVGRLLVRLMRDPRVPWQGKVVAAGAAAYVLSPVDVLPDIIPVIGQVDDVYLMIRAVRVLIRRAGYDVVRERWPGTEDGFAALLVLAGLER